MSLKLPVQGHAVLVAIVVALATLPFVGSADARPRASSYRIKAISHNLAGGMIGRGGPQSLDDVNRHIALFHPDVVGMQEVCGGQVDAFKAQHPRWSMTATLQRARYGHCSGDLYDVLASKWPMSNITATNLGHAVPATGKTFHLTCADLAISGTARTRACTTHVRANQGDETPSEGQAIRNRQIRLIADTLRPYIARGRQVVVTGDFNSGPQAMGMDWMYRIDRAGRLRGAGQFHEGDQTDRRYCTNPTRRCRTKEPTLERGTSRLDYVFFNRTIVADGRQLTEAVYSTTTSDHKLVRAWAETGG